jgi:GNAT superfamily N-acetyltransferase
MLTPDIVRSVQDLQQILQLQKQNLKQYISEQERNDQGFVTLEHSLAVLEAMHQLAPSILIRDGDKVIAYALTELPACRHLMPDLEPMFALLDTMSWKDQPINDQRFYTMGQICIAREYRGQGLFEALYEHHRQVYRPSFDLFITEISTRNPRSLRAHEKLGFQTIHTHRDELDEWSMVLWDWS